MTLNAKLIADSIADISITGLKIKSVDAIPDQVTSRDCPILFPEPVAFLSGGAGAVEDELTFGAATDRLWHFNRTFRYIYLHAPIQSERRIATQYTALLAMVDNIMVKLTELDIDDVDIMGINLGGVGTIQDPSSGTFYGCTIDIVTREKVHND